MAYLPRSHPGLSGPSEQAPPRVVFAGEAVGTSRSRYLALCDLEGDVHHFDPQSRLGRFGRRAVLEAKTLHGPAYRAVNREFLAFCDEVRPDVLWLDSGGWIFPTTLRALRSRGVFLVHHNTDALRPIRWQTRWLYRLMRWGLGQFDLYFTTNLVDYDALSARARPKTELTYLGYDHTRFDAAPLSADEAGQYASDLLFMGHYETRTERYILALIDAGLPVTVYGPHWQNARHLDRLKGHVQFRSATDEEYVKRIKGAKIGLCFVSEWHLNQTAGRSFEIPACGTFLLAMRTEQHAECYVEGEEAEFFGDSAELVRKARYYLEHDEARRRIALQGHARCTDSDYSYARFMRDDWAKVRAALDTHRQALSTVADFEGRSS